MPVRIVKKASSAHFFAFFFAGREILYTFVAHSNLNTSITNIYEARFVSGVVAGMKIKELADAKKIPAKSYNKDKKVKVGYVGAFPYAEVVSGYTAFYLGIKSVYEVCDTSL